MRVLVKTRAARATLAARASQAYLRLRQSRSTAGRPALHGSEPGQVRKEAATAILCKCRGYGSPPSSTLRLLSERDHARAVYDDVARLARCSDWLCSRARARRRHALDGMSRRSWAAATAWTWGASACSGTGSSRWFQWRRLASRRLLGSRARLLESQRRRARPERRHRRCRVHARVARCSRTASRGPYVEAGIGLHLLSHSSIGDKRLSTAFQFGDHLGVGYRFGAKRRIRSGLSLPAPLEREHQETESGNQFSSGAAAVSLLRRMQRVSTVSSRRGSAGSNASPALTLPLPFTIQ